jgi:glyoxylase-like metal-dependent hydrolase (beta-lactamase superfamily II)
MAGVEDMGSDVPVESVDPEELRDRIESGEPVTILDVRAESEFDAWHIDGENVTVANVPYYDFLEGVDEDLLSRVPEGDPVIAICAKGGASEYVAGLLIQEGVDAVNLAEGMNGWASVYDAVELDVEGPGTVVQFQRPSSGCLSYLVVEGGEAAVVDPLRAFTDRYVAAADGYDATVEHVLDTHIHADHVSGVRDLARETGATAHVPEPSVARGVEYGVSYEPIADGDVVDVGEATIEAVHTPGHTSGMTSYLVDDQVLCTGDGLFVESVARPDLEKGADGAPDAAAQLYDTLQELLELPDDTLVAPGHFSDAATPAADGSYTARLADLRDSMAALHMERDEFVEFILSDMPPRPANHEEIIAINLGQQDADDDEAFELELGPNNCAASQEALTSD